MPDTLDVLRRLADTPPAEPPDVSTLRRRIARRRRRRAAVAGAALAAVTVVAALSWPGDAPTQERVVTEPEPTPDAEADPEAEPGSTTTTAPPPATPVALPLGTVVSGVDGVSVVGADGRLTERWDRPSATAFTLAGVVVAQEALVQDPLPLMPWSATGPIAVVEATRVRALPIVGAERLQLLDVGVVDGRAVAVAGSQTGAFIDDTDLRLLLIDLETAERRDLGRVAGWESAFGAARLYPDGVLFTWSVGANWFVEMRRFDGTTVWTHAGDDEGPPTLAASATRASLVDVTFVDGRWQLAVTDLDLAFGPIDTEVVELELDGDVACIAAEWLDDSVLCSGSSGPPVVIEPATGATDVIAGLPGGVIVRMPRAVTPSPCTAEQQAVADVDGDGEADSVYNHWDAVRVTSVLGVCLASGDVLELPVGAENVWTIDVEPDGRAEILHSGTTAIMAFNSIAVVLDSTLRDVVGEDGQPFVFETGTFPGEDPDVPGAGVFGCDDVDGDGRRELVVANANLVDAEVRWTTHAYALDGATARQVDAGSGTEPPMSADELFAFVTSLAPPC